DLIALDPAGKRLAVWAPRQPLAFGIFEVETETLANMPQVVQRGLTALAWSADGGWLAAANDDLRVVVWDARTGRRLVECTAPQGFVEQLAFSGDGKLLVGTGQDDTVRLWDARTGQQLLSSPGGGGPLQFSPDYQGLALARNGLVVGTWRVSVSREFSVLRSEQAAGLTAQAQSVSPDGRLLATGHMDGFRLWDLAANKEVTLMPA